MPLMIYSEEIFTEVSIVVFLSSAYIYIYKLLHRHACAQNRAAYQELTECYSENLIGTVIEGILLVHKEQNIRYTLSEEADRVYECIIDKLNDQFNLKYTSASQIPDSQPDLNNNEKSELSVRTKVIEIIGRLSCASWIYCKGTYVRAMLLKY